jgi:hypothetical protein
MDRNVIWGGHKALRMAMAAVIAFGLVVVVPASTLSAQETDSSKTSAEAQKDSTKESKKEEKEKKAGGAGIVPIPIFVTEPAIGYGLGAAVGYFHPRKNEAEPEPVSISPALTTGIPPDQATEDGKKRPPTITGVAAAYTVDGTWGVGVGHSASWRDDRIRYKGALAYVNVESTFYFANIPFGFALKGGVLYQDIKFRLGSSDFMLGGMFSYVNMKGQINLSDEAPVDLGDGPIADSGLGAQAVWDTRDNTMTPDRGQFFELAAWRYDEALAGDFNYWKGSLRLLSFHQFGEKFVLGLRLDLDGVSGDPPLWGYPWITLRGVPALRYQNELVGVVETELRWNIFTRWAVVGFVGTGSTTGDVFQYEDESGIVAGGVGGRFLFRPQDRLWVGIDVAWGPEKAYMYIQVGHAW